MSFPSGLSGLLALWGSCNVSARRWWQAPVLMHGHFFVWELGEVLRYRLATSQAQALPTPPVHSFSMWQKVNPKSEHWLRVSFRTWRMVSRWYLGSLFRGSQYAQRWSRLETLPSAMLPPVFSAVLTSVWEFLEVVVLLSWSSVTSTSSNLLFLL